MSERKYSVQEINRMRSAIEESYPYTVAYHPDQRAKDVEQRLQTYMLNRTEPEELERERNAVLLREQRAQLARQGR